MRLLIFLVLLFPLGSIATVPATLMPLTKENIHSLGFRVEVSKGRNNISATLYAPPQIEGNWKLVGTQSYPYVGEKSVFLSKVGIVSPSKETDIYISYDSEVSDAFVGVYYVCVEASNSSCSRVGAERLYFIDSLNAT